MQNSSQQYKPEAPASEPGFAKVFTRLRFGLVSARHQVLLLGLYQPKIKTWQLVAMRYGQLTAVSTNSSSK